MLKMLGIAATINEDTVTVLAGQSIRSAPDDEILRILKQGAFIDSVAFQALCEMGYAELTGADYVDSFPLNTTYPVSGERFYNEKFGGTPLHAFSLAIHGQRPLFTVMKPHRGSPNSSIRISNGCFREPAHSPINWAGASWCFRWKSPGSAQDSKLRHAKNGCMIF